MAVKTFTTGEVLTAADTNTYLANSGLVYIKSQTIGSAVASVNITSAFDTTYDVYLITISGGAGSTIAGGSLKLGTTATGYYNSGYSVPYTGAASAQQNNNGTLFTNALVVTTDSVNAYIILNGPNLAKRTYFSASYIFGNPAGGGDALNTNGYLNNTTQYTDFTVSFGGANVTGGTITLYGYRKA